MFRLSQRPLSRSTSILIGVSAAMLFGVALAETTPTNMLDRSGEDWRERLPPAAATLSYIGVGSAPESAELGRRPLDPAYLAGTPFVPPAAYAYAPVDYAPADYAPPEWIEPEATEPPVATVLVHRGTDKTVTEALPATGNGADNPEPSEPGAEAPAGQPPQG